MLLSEVIQIAKHIKQYTPINEAYNANIIRQIVNPVNRYSILDIQSKSGYMDVVKDGNDLIWAYKRKYRNVPEMLDDYFNKPEGRDAVLNQRIFKYKVSFINTINNRLKDQCDMQIDIANISDDQIEIIDDITLAKKKPYKSCLQFWVNNDTNQLIAITCQNKIICVCKQYKSDMYSIPLNNKNFVGHYTQEECKQMLDEVDERNYTLFKEFYSKAFKLVNKVNIYDTDKDIKKELNTIALSINKLLEYFQEQQIYNIRIYAVNSEGMEQNNITEKMNLREEYKKYLIMEKRFLHDQQERYRNYVKEQKGKQLKNKTENKVKQFLELCLDAYNECIQLQVQFLTKSPDDLKIPDNRYGIYMKVNNYSAQSYFYNFIYDAYHNNSLSQTLYNKFLYVSRKSREYQSFEIKNKIDLLIFLSVAIQFCIAKLTTISNLYIEIDNTDDNNKIVKLISDVKIAINSIDVIKNSNIFPDVYNYAQKSNITSILKYITNIQQFNIQ